MKRIAALIISIFLLISLCIVPVFALSYYVSHYEEAIYAGGIVDLYAYPSVGESGDFTYQWQYDAGFGDGHWYDVVDNDSYSGSKTNHLQVFTATGNYDGWQEIPFQCKVTAADGTVRYTDNIFMNIYPTDKLIPNMQKWGYGLYEPHIDNAIDLYTKDDIVYTASAYAGTKLRMWCGHMSVDAKPVLRKSEVKLELEIHITENGHTTISGNDTTYMPYTFGTIQVAFKEKLTIGKFDLGYFDTKTVNLTVSKPTTLYTAKTDAACSLLRYTYNESQKLASIPKGATLDIVGTEGSYYQVCYNDYIGYVPKSILSNTTDALGDLITEVDVTIAAPVAGEPPLGTCIVETEGCELYKTDPVTWVDESNGTFLTATDKFQEGKRYTVSIWLAAKSGYHFQTDASGNPKLGGAINGNLPPFIHKAYEQDPEQVIELSYTFVAKAQAAENTQPPVSPTVPIHTHTPSEWRSTGGYHYKACVTCGDFLTQEEHKGGAATCQEEGMCSVCGYAYLDRNESHVPNMEVWTACGNLYHAHICKLCGAHCDAQDHTPGAEATDTTPQTCTTCGYIMQPAKNHTHQLSHMPYVAPTCFATGTVEHYSCSGCSGLFADEEGTKQLPAGTNVIIPYLTHETADEWQMDENYHWRCCSLCQTVLDETKMVHQNRFGTCSTCNFGIPQHTKEASHATVIQTPQRNPIWFIVIFVMVATAVVVIVLVTRKRK